MQVLSMQFKARAGEKLADQRLQAALKKNLGNMTRGRARAVAAYEDFEGLREAGRVLRNRVLAQLDVWLERFEAEATRRGATVLWARDGEEVNRLVGEIAQRHGVQKVVKSKSMVSEEAGLNPHLEALGMQVVETDLGEYIAQQAGERPSHLIAPVLHKSKEEVAELFERKHGLPRKREIAEMTLEARQVLRPHFLSADMGISGGNFLIAETGSVVLVTNEGNGRMCTTLPRVHVAITGIEKVLPTLEDFSTIIRLLARSATGQAISNYVTMLTGVRGTDDLDGPQHMYFVLVDNGRSALIGSEFQDMLRCIRCGACMNHCPVYLAVGGHSYGWVYPGPMGSVLTPLYAGIEKAVDLPNASTLCGECEVVCPVKIPLPDLMRKLRDKQVELGLRPWTERLGIWLWRYAAARPRLYALLSRAGSRLLHWLGGASGVLRRVPFGPGWSDARDMRAPPGKTFRDLYRQRKGGG